MVQLIRNIDGLGYPIRSRPAGTLPGAEQGKSWRPPRALCSGLRWVPVAAAAQGPAAAAGPRSRRPRRRAPRAQMPACLLRASAAAPAAAAARCPPGGRGPPPRHPRQPPSPRLRRRPIEAAAAGGRAARIRLSATLDRPQRRGQARRRPRRSSSSRRPSRCGSSSSSSSSNIFCGVRRWACPACTPRWQARGRARPVQPAVHPVRHHRRGRWARR